MQGLTARQQLALSAIVSSIADRGYPPTLRELGNALGITSTNGVNDHLRALERKGMIVRADLDARGIRVTGTGLALAHQLPDVNRIPTRRMRPRVDDVDRVLVRALSALDDEHFTAVFYEACALRMQRRSVA